MKYPVTEANRTSHKKQKFTMQSQASILRTVLMSAENTFMPDDLRGHGKGENNLAFYVI